VRHFDTSTKIIEFGSDKETGSSALNRRLPAVVIAVKLGLDPDPVLERQRRRRAAALGGKGARRAKDVPARRELSLMLTPSAVSSKAPPSVKSADSRYGSASPPSPDRQSPVPQLADSEAERALFVSYTG
jgi:hypothetical protein